MADHQDRFVCRQDTGLSTQCSALNFSAPVSLREKLLVPKERPEKGLSSGLSSFSLRETGAEKLRVVGYWSKSTLH